MFCNLENFNRITHILRDKDCTLVAVSKMKPVAAIRELYDLGQRDFGENYVQELLEKAPQLPSDIRWHFIGHLQTNKAKYLVPLVHLIHGVDSIKLLKEINKQSARAGIQQAILLQVHIAQETTKFGFSAEELQDLFLSGELQEMEHVQISGLMGMASFSEDPEQVKKEFATLRALYDQYKTDKRPNVDFSILSMGMSGDYELALENGSNMVRIGSLLFGSRNKLV